MIQGLQYLWYSALHSVRLRAESDRLAAEQKQDHEEAAWRKRYAEQNKFTDSQKA